MKATKYNVLRLAIGRYLIDIPLAEVDEFFFTIPDDGDPDSMGWESAPIAQLPAWLAQRINVKPQYITATAHIKETEYITL